MLSRIDMWLIERVFERFSHWWQKTVSYTQDCFSLAVGAAAVSFIMIVIVALDMLWVGIYIMLVPSAVMGLYTYFIYITSQFTREEVYRGLLCGHSNDSKISEFPYRMVILCVIIISGLMIWVMIPLCFSVLSSLYLLTCDPLPPGSEKSRLENWAASFKEKLTLAPAPILNPAS